MNEESFKRLYDLVMEVNHTNARLRAHKNLIKNYEDHLSDVTISITYGGYQGIVGRACPEFGRFLELLLASKLEEFTRSVHNLKEFINDIDL